MEAITPELGPVRFWSPKSSSFSGSDSIVVVGINPTKKERRQKAEEKEQEN